MKHLIIGILISLFAASYASAQDFPAPGHRPGPELDGNPMMNQEKKRFPSREELQSQKIAFFTQELELTPEEAQKFWPVYNAGNKKVHAARKQINMSLKELNNTIKAEDKASDSQVKSLMNNYFKACEEEIEAQSEMFDELAKVLPVEKAAKTFTLEERFRVMLIRQLKR